MNHRPQRSRFFLYSSYALFAIVLAGFAPTFYLRAQFGMPAIPGYVFAHGVLLTAWYAWFCLQTSAVAAGRIAWHRRFGVAGAVLAVPVALSGAVVALCYGPRLLGTYGAAATDATRVSMVVWGNLGMLAAFVTFFSAGIYHRRRAGAHRRLMFLAAVSLVPPALARIARNPWRELPEPLVMGGGLGLLLIALAVTDRRTRSRLHPVTLIGGTAFTALLFVAVAIGRTEPGRRFAFLFA